MAKTTRRSGGAKAKPKSAKTAQPTAKTATGGRGGRSRSLDPAGGASPSSGGSSVTVPSTKVGTAVQAAVSGDGARRVVAEATDAAATTFRVSW